MASGLNESSSENIATCRFNAGVAAGVSQFNRTLVGTGYKKYGNDLFFAIIIR